MHYALYGFMIIMPASGIAMGYYGGKGLPFFTTTLAGAKESNGAIAKNVSRPSVALLCLRVLEISQHSLSTMISSSIFQGLSIAQASWHIWQIFSPTSHWWSCPTFSSWTHHFCSYEPLSWTSYALETNRMTFVVITRNVWYTQ